MQLNRDKEGRIIINNQKDEEIHPFVTVLAGIEMQKTTVFSVKLPELNVTGWDVVINALKFAIESLPEPEQVPEPVAAPQTPEPPKRIKKVKLITPAEKKLLREKQLLEKASKRIAK